MKKSEESFVLQAPKKGRGNRKKSPQQNKQKTLLSDQSFDYRLQSQSQATKSISRSQTSFLQNLNNDKKNDSSDDQPDKISEKQQKQQDQQELQPDKPNNSKDLNISNWDDVDSKKQQDNTKTVQKQKQYQPQGRGNRGNRSTQKKSYINPDHQLPSGQNNSQTKKRGNRFPDQQKGNFHKKNYYQSNNNQSQGYNNRDRYERGRGRGGRGGYRGGGGGYNRNYNDRNYNNNDRNYNNNQNNKNFDTDKETDQTTYKNPNFNKNNKFYENKRRDYNQNNNYNQRDRTSSYQRNQPQIIQKIVEKIVEKEVIKQIIIQKQKPRPKGTRAQPELSIFVKGCKVTLTCRRLQQFTADVLIIPYKTLKMQLYPGSIINSCQTNYKQKIKSKGQSLEAQGSVYLQKCIGYDKAKAFAFMKIGDPQNSLKGGISNLFKNISLINQSDKSNVFENLIFPICQKLGAFKTLILSLIKQIDKYSFIKDVYITTEQPKTFCEAVTKFNEVFQQLYEENDISMN